MSKKELTEADVILDAMPVAAGGPAQPLPAALAERGWHDCIETTTVVEQMYGKRTFLAAFPGEPGRYKIRLTLDVAAGCTASESLLQPVEIPSS